MKSKLSLMEYLNLWSCSQSSLPGTGAGADVRFVASAVAGSEKAFSLCEKTAGRKLLAATASGSFAGGAYVALLAMSAALLFQH